jgi:hypothetical protein
MKLQLSDLSNDVLGLILDAIGRQTDVSLSFVLSLRRVSQLWLSVMKNNFTEVGTRTTKLRIRTQADLDKLGGILGQCSFPWASKETWCLNSPSVKTLHTLDLVGCSRLRSVDALAAAPALHTLDLSGCTGLSSVDALATAPALHTLNLYGCTGLANVDALATAPALHTLDLVGCSRLRSVDALAAAPALHTLDLSGCTGLANVDGLATAPALHTLDLGDCTGLSSVDDFVTLAVKLEHFIRP